MHEILTFALHFWCFYALTFDIFSYILFIYSTILTFSLCKYQLTQFIHSKSIPCKQKRFLLLLKRYLVWCVLAVLWLFYRVRASWYIRGNMHSLCCAQQKNIKIYVIFNTPFHSFSLFTKKESACGFLTPQASTGLKHVIRDKREKKPGPTFL